MKTNQNNKKTVPTQEQIEVVCRQRARHFWNWLTWSLVYYVATASMSALVIFSPGA